MHLKDIEWAGIVYSMENGRVVKCVVIPAVWFLLCVCFRTLLVLMLALPSHRVTHGVKTWRDGDPSHGHRDIQSQ